MEFEKILAIIEGRILYWILLLVGLAIILFGAYLQLSFSVTIGVTAAIIILIGVVAVISASAIAYRRK